MGQLPTIWSNESK